MNCEYFWQYSRNKKHELLIRQFLLVKADTLRLTRIINTEWKFPFRFVKYGDDNDKRFLQTLALLRPYFIKKIANNKRFNDISQGNNQFEHYFYQLSKQMKQKINKNTLFWWKAEPYITGDFYCLEDPCFYRGKEMISVVVSHEQYIILYLTSSEREKFERQGIIFEKG
ncbi:hypothetical protein HYY69_02655 [Candidatus Woesearchaeota archaeon]|nr:hypothetical protein [Candidatus Woesearchaeota archaeon]